MTNEQLDALVAEKVMGWTLDETPGYPYYVHYSTGGDPALDEPLSPVDWSPTFRIDQAWQVVERMAALEFRVSMSYDANRHGAQYSFEFMSRYPLTRYGTAAADSAPLAICMAALKALGVDVE